MIAHLSPKKSTRKGNTLLKFLNDTISKALKYLTIYTNNKLKKKKLQKTKTKKNPKNSHQVVNRSFRGQITEDLHLPCYTHAHRSEHRSTDSISNQKSMRRQSLHAVSVSYSSPMQEVLPRQEQPVHNPTTPAPFMVFLNFQSFLQLTCFNLIFLIKRKLRHREVVGKRVTEITCQSSGPELQSDQKHSEFKENKKGEGAHVHLQPSL